MSVRWVGRLDIASVVHSLKKIKNKFPFYWWFWNRKKKIEILILKYFEKRKFGWKNIKSEGWKNKIESKNHEIPKWWGVERNKIRLNNQTTKKQDRQRPQLLLVDFHEKYLPNIIFELKSRKSWALAKPSIIQRELNQKSNNFLKENFKK